MKTVLVADDDPHIRQVVCFALAKGGFATLEAADGEQALAVFDAKRPDLVVLDVMMPEVDGTEVCREIRRRSDVPILFLSARDDEIDRVVGFEIGGDDYVTKPFSPRELVARVGAILRRAVPAPAPVDELRHGRLTLDVVRMRALWDDRELSLTATEFGILRTLTAMPGRVYTRDNLMDGAYDVRRIVSDRTIDSHVRRLRDKFRAIDAEPIETVHGVGYRLGPCDR